MPQDHAIEKKWQKIWKEQKAFVPSIDSSKEKYFATNAYPYANSIMHIGHGRTFVATDIIVRYHRLLGKNVLYPMGFHISGTPVLAVSDAISRGDETQKKLSLAAIKEYEPDEKKAQEILNTFTDPMHVAKFFSDTIEETFDSVGLSVDWSRQFTTGDEAYQKFITWQFKRLEDAGILTQGKYPILYSAVDENAVGEDDIKDGDTDKVTVQEMTYILFKLKSSDEYIAVATLRPDALFGATNLWVDPTFTLVRAKVNGQVWIVTKDAFVKLEHQYDEVELVEEFSAKDLHGKIAITPLINREVPIADASFIDPKHGTGMVYSSPAGSPHDYLGLVEAKQEGRLSKDVEVINTVETKDKKGNIIAYDGCCPAEALIKKHNITKSDDPKLEQVKQELYKEEHYGGKLTGLGEPWDGLPIKHAKEKVQQALVEANLGGVFYEPSRRAATRAGHQVIVANLQGQWFLDYSKDETKQKAHEVLNQMDIVPENMTQSQAGYLDWVQKRPCARKRGIGTPLPQDPQWVIESLSDSTIYQLFYHVAYYVNEKKISPEELTPEVCDYLFSDKNLPDGANDIFKEIKKEVEYWKSFDLRYTAPTHMSNHLSFLIYHYGLLIPKKYWPKNITLGGLLIRNGHKISKSKGNGIPLIHVGKEFGADLYRLYIGVGTNIEAEFDFRDEDIWQLQKKFEKFKELMFLAKEQTPKQYDEYSDVDKWLISRFYSSVKRYFAHMDDYRIREAYIAILFDVLNDLNYHTRRSSQEQTINTLAFFFEDYAKLMTPVTPHICEELYEGRDGLVSLASYDTNTTNFINKEIEDREAIIQELLQSITKRIPRAREEQQKECKKIVIQQAPKEMFDLFDVINGLLKETKEFKVILPKLKDQFPQHMKFITKFVPKTLSSGLQFYEARDTEKEFLESLTGFIAKEFDCEVTLGEHPNALPGGPRVLLE